ncbi:DMT family transporter [Mycobacterium sp. DL592]|uniref:DMT family transporter n=1 Tax=Mycobacterium sp. DL592 TaxID=2675524 RepID=UPI001423992E|nr:DMT family transporter [Mycobacterium sp. DL592]
MGKAEIATILTLCAALCIAIGDVIQQRSAQTVTDEPVGHAALFLHLLRDWRWWLGSLVAGGGFAFQAAALGFGSVLLVQALMVTSLLFALPISARYAGRRVTRVQWIWAVLLAGAVAVIVTVGNPTEGQSRAGWELWVWVIATLGPVLVLCLVGARLLGGGQERSDPGMGTGGQERSDPGMGRGKPAAAVLLGVVAGSLWGLFAVLTKGVVDRLADGIWALLKTPELYPWAVVAVVATALQQSAFRAGSLAASLPAVTVSEPMVGSILGVFVLGETLRADRAGWLVLIVAVVVMVAATVALARGEVVSGRPAAAPG